MNPEAYAETSKMAYNSLTPEWKATKQAIVYNTIFYYGPICRERISELSTLKGSTVRPRVIELIRQGLIEIRGLTVRNGRQVELIAIRDG